MRHLSEDIGGTIEIVEHPVVDGWLADKAHEVERECQRLVELDPERKLEWGVASTG